MTKWAFRAYFYGVLPIGVIISGFCHGSEWVILALLGPLVVAGAISLVLMAIQDAESEAK